MRVARRPGPAHAPVRLLSACPSASRRSLLPKGSTRCSRGLLLEAQRAAPMPGCPRAAAAGPRVAARLRAAAASAPAGPRAADTGRPPPSDPDAAGVEQSAAGRGGAPLPVGPPEREMEEHMRERLRGGWVGEVIYTGPRVRPMNPTRDINLLIPETWCSSVKSAYEC